MSYNVLRGDPMGQTHAIESDAKGHGLPRALHLRISELEASSLEAHAERLATERKTRVSMSEAARDLMAKGLQAGLKPWEQVLQSLPFVAWEGGKPKLPPAGQPSEGKPLSVAILEGREDRL